MSSSQGADEIGSSQFRVIDLILAEIVNINVDDHLKPRGKVRVAPNVKKLGQAGPSAQRLWALSMKWMRAAAEHNLNAEFSAGGSEPERESEKTRSYQVGAELAKRMFDFEVQLQFHVWVSTNVRLEVCEDFMVLMVGGVHEVSESDPYQIVLGSQ